MNYAAAVKHGMPDKPELDDAPPGFASQPSPMTVKTVSKKPSKTVEDPTVGADEEVSMWSNAEDSSEDDFMDSYEQDEEETTSVKRYVKKGTDIAALKKKEAAEKNQKKGPRGGFQKSQLQVEFQNIKNLVLSRYGDSLNTLDSIVKELNYEMLANIKNKEQSLKSSLVQLSQPKTTEKPAWKGNERAQENNFGKGGKKADGKGKNNKNKRREPKKTSKVTVTLKDKDGFYLKKVVTAEEAQAIDTEVDEFEVDETVVVPTQPSNKQKKAQKKATSTVVTANNPFGAVLLAGSFESKEAEAEKLQKRKALAAKQNKAKQQRAGQAQNQKIKQLEQQTSGAPTQTKGKKKRGNKKPVNKNTQQTQTQNQQKKPKQNQNQKKKNQPQKGKGGSQKKNNKKQKVESETVSKEKEQRRRQKEAEKKRLENEEKRIQANQRDIEKEKKLRRLARKNQKDQEPWYESEYAQPAALVGACALVLAVVYSFVFQA